MTGIQEAKTWDVSRQALEETTTRIEKVSTERRAAFEDLCQIQARIDAHRESLVAKGGPPSGPSVHQAAARVVGGHERVPREAAATCNAVP
jgi:hypothetical protein